MISDETMRDLASEINGFRENIVLLFAFNGTGKTRLSVEYKNLTKELNEDNHAGVYYNAYSEDLFYWNNDELALNIMYSSLNQYHSSLDEERLKDKLSIYKPKFDFRFNIYKDNAERGIESVTFYEQGADIDDDSVPIKISRGEQQAFIWCLFLTMFDIQGWTGIQNTHFFIDDPVSSLDDHNIFITASTIMDLIEEHYKNRKIIITTHHVGIFSILADWLSKGEKASSYKNKVKKCILKTSGDSIELTSIYNDVFLYHLELLQVLQTAINEDKIYAYHFATLRQVLENISSFLGVGRFSYVLEQIGISDIDEIAMIVNTLSHKNIFKYEAKEMVPDNKERFIDIFNKIMEKYRFVIHTRREE
jgi:hypothetical protein